MWACSQPPGAWQHCRCHSDPVGHVGCRETVSPPDKLGVAEAQAALAAVLQAQGSHPEAEQCWKTALSAQESILGLQHPLAIQTHQCEPPCHQLRSGDMPCQQTGSLCAAHAGADGPGAAGVTSRHLLSVPVSLRLCTKTAQRYSKGQSALQWLSGSSCSSPVTSAPLPAG